MGKTPADDAASSDDESSYEMLVATPAKNKAIAPQETAETMKKMELEIEHLKKENGLLEKHVNDIMYILFTYMKRSAVITIICFAANFLFVPKEYLTSFVVIMLVLSILEGILCGYIFSRDNPIEYLIKLYPRPEITETTEPTSTSTQQEKMEGSDPITTTNEAVVTTSATSVDLTNTNDADMTSTEPPPEMEESAPSPVATEGATPEAPTNNDADMTVRTLTITKEADWTWGFYWVNYCVRRVIPGSSADLNGLRRGDQIIAIDGARLDRMDNGEYYKGVNVAWRLADARGIVTLEVRQNPDRLKKIEKEEKFKRNCEGFAIDMVVFVIFIGILYSLIQFLLSYV